jgi:hypothetical protein
LGNQEDPIGVVDIVTLLTDDDWLYNYKASCTFLLSANKEEVFKVLETNHRKRSMSKEEGCSSGLLGQPILHEGENCFGGEGCEI